MLIDKNNAALILASLRWDVDQCVYWYEYDAYYWLKPCFNKAGERMGRNSLCRNCKANYE